MGTVALDIGCLRELKSSPPMGALIRAYSLILVTGQVAMVMPRKDCHTKTRNFPIWTNIGHVNGNHICKGARLVRTLCLNTLAALQICNSPT